MSKSQFLKLLTDHQLNYQLHEHEAIFTVEQGKHLHPLIQGAHSKNLFLKDKKNFYCLVSILEHKRMNINLFAKTLGLGRLSFANAEELMAKLHLIPGAVTPFGLVNDQMHEVKFFLDEDFLTFDIVNFHPLQNDATIGMAIDPFLRFFELIAHKPEIIKIPE